MNPNYKFSSAVLLLVCVQLKRLFRPLFYHELMDESSAGHAFRFVIDFTCSISDQRTSDNDIGSGRIWAGQPSGTQPPIPRIMV
jgi:hypothetical protein